MQQDKYLYVRVWVGVLLRRQDRFLLVQEGPGVTFQQWGIPGGRIEVGHRPEESAVREAKEEVGFDVKLDREVGVFHIQYDAPVHHVFLAAITGGELSYDQDEIIDAKWLTIEEIEAKRDELRFPWLIELVKSLA